MAGGLSALSSEASFFNQNFLTDAQRIAPVAAALDKALASLGLATIPTTRDEFAALVKGLIESGAAATEAGAKQLSSLLGLSEAFAQVHTASETLAKTESSLADERKTLQGQLDQLTMSSAQLLVKQRELIGESNRALFDQVQAATAVQTARTNLNAAYQQEQQNITTLRDRMQSLSSTWTKLLADLKLGSSSPLTPQQKYLEAKTQYEQTLAAAKAGDKTAQDNYATVTQAFLEASRTANASSAAYTSDFNMVQAGLTDAAAWASKQVDVATASLDALKTQVAGLIDINTSVLSVRDAMSALGAAMLKASSIGTPLPSSTTIEGLYQTLLGRSADSAGLSYWQGVQGQGYSTSDIANMISQSAEYQSSKIDDLYQSLLGRSADAAGSSYWQEAMGKGVTLSDIESMIRNGDEYQSQHPGTAYSAASMKALTAQSTSSGSGPTGAQVDTLIKEISAMRGDLQVHADSQANVTLEAAGLTAAAVTQGAVKGAETAAYQARNAEAIA